jgi:GntR family transcriptional repressor for pyruvate dehydrogenase complex
MTARFQSVAPTVRLADQVADALAAEVRSGRLSEGDRLPTEAALAEQFGVSRTVVREAVSRLKSLGLLDSRQGSGVYVRAAGVEPLRFEMPHVASREAVIQMVELRRALEAEVAALAAERRTPEDVQRIRQAIDSLHAAVAAGGNGADEDVRFHRAIAEAARNPFLIGTLQYLRQFLHGATRVTRANEARRAQIVAAIEAGDPLRAREAAKSHMDNAIRRIEQADPAFWEHEGAQLAQTLVEGWPAGK